LRGQGSGSPGAGGGLVGLEVTVANVWRRALGFDSGYPRDAGEAARDAGEAALGAGAHWFDLGGDSVLAIRYSVSLLNLLSLLAKVLSLLLALRHSVYSSLYGTQFTLLAIRYSVYFTRSTVRSLLYSLYGTQFTLRGPRYQVLSLLLAITTAVCSSLWYSVCSLYGTQFTILIAWRLRPTHA
jgi:hypothetical protein